MDKIINKIKTFVQFTKENKEILVLAYLIGICIQIAILLYILGFAGLSYLSVTYSLVLFIIVLSLFLLSIPILFVVLLSIILISSIGIWLSGLLGKVILIILFLTIFSIKKFNLFENQRKKISNKYGEKIDSIYTKYFLIIFLLIFLFTIIATFSFKIATIKYGENKIITGKYLFYNQDYYFLEVCGTNLIIPTNKVESIEIKTESYKFSSMKSDEISKLNTEYNNFCNDYLNKNKIQTSK